MNKTIKYLGIAGAVVLLCFAFQPVGSQTTGGSANNRLETESAYWETDGVWTNDAIKTHTFSGDRFSTLLRIEAACGGVSATGLTFNVLARVGGSWDAGGVYVVTNQVADVDGIIITTFLTNSFAPRTKFVVEIIDEDGEPANFAIDFDHWK